MIQVNGIDHVNVSVRDLARSLRFYTETFGLELKEDGRARERPFVIVGRAGVAYLALHESKDAGPAAHPAINHWGFVVGDLDPVLDRLEADGVKIRFTDTYPRGVIEYPRSRSVYVEDPDGHEIELTEAFGGGLD
ncbi:VOC family protein [Lentisalinibacter salinarum]|uniref:VOC family protein n=1 Tax=Lentisalinibacter salinarum TaxID=2992239 RepID=UPI0038655B7D